jgi:putative glutathione S-transferase
LKGLEDVIGLTYVHPTWQYTKAGMDEHRGWVFGSKDGDNLTSTSGAGSFPSSWGEEDPNMNAKTIRDIYEKVNDTTERYILPVLWDKKLKTIVSNESSEIIRMLNLEFNEYASNPDLNLYPESLADKIDEINQWVSDELMLS